MQQQEIRSLIAESRREGGITALEEYDKTRKLPFQKERVLFTIEHSLMKKFRKKCKGQMSSIVEKKIREVVS